LAKIKHKKHKKTLDKEKKKKCTVSCPHGKWEDKGGKILCSKTKGS
jgi:hypothetical protein